MTTADQLEKIYRYIIYGEPVKNSKYIQLIIDIYKYSILDTSDDIVEKFRTVSPDNIDSLMKDVDKLYNDTVSPKVVQKLNKKLDKMKLERTKLKKDVKGYLADIQRLEDNIKERDKTIRDLNKMVSELANQKPEYIIRDKYELKYKQLLKSKEKELEGYAKAKLEDEKFRRMLRLKGKKYGVSGRTITYRIINNSVEFMIGGKVIQTKEYNNE